MMDRSTRIARGLAIAGAMAAAGLAAAPLQAQGSALDQHSACMSARVGAGVADPCPEASAVFFSPAALADHPTNLTGGVLVVWSSNRFRYDPATAPPPPADAEVLRETERVLVPHVFAAYRASPRLAAGIGFFAPYGLGLHWPVCPVEDIQCGESNFEGRFTGYDNSLRSYYVQPTVAYQVVPGVLNVGAGVDYVRATIGVRRRIPGPAEVGLGSAEVADADLNGSGSTLTAHVGATLRLTPRSLVGVRYLHSARVDLEGRGAFQQIPTGNPLVDLAVAQQFQPGGQLADQPVSGSIEFPAHLVVGISHRPVPQLNLLADFQRTWWSSFDVLDMRFQDAGTTVPLELDYRDANTFRFAADYAATEMVSVRAGFRYNTAATPRATPFLPENERNYYTVGLGLRPLPRLTADLAFQHMVQPDRAGSVRPGGVRAGVYEGTGTTFSLTMSYRPCARVP
jgi:long-chain fatty acid transport protein